MFWQLTVDKVTFVWNEAETLWYDRAETRQTDSVLSVNNVSKESFGLADP